MLTGTRVPLLVVEERTTARLHVYHGQAHLFLRIPTQEIRKATIPISMKFAKYFAERSRQVRIPLEIRSSKSQIQSLLVSVEGRCAIIFY